MTPDQTHAQARVVVARARLRAAELAQALTRHTCRISRTHRDGPYDDPEDCPRCALGRSSEARLAFDRPVWEAEAALALAVRLAQIAERNPPPGSRWYVGAYRGGVEVPLAGPFLAAEDALLAIPDVRAVVDPHQSADGYGVLRVDPGAPTLPDLPVRQDVQTGGWHLDPRYHRHAGGKRITAYTHAPVGA